MTNEDREKAGPAETSTRLVEGRLLAMRVGLAVAPDCLGRTYKTVIGGQPLKVLLPAPDPQDPDRLPLLVAPALIYEHPPVTPQVLPWEWGKVNSADRNGWVSADIAMLAYQFQVTGSDEDMTQVCRLVGEQVPAWWDRLEMWLDTFTDLDLLHHGRYRLDPDTPEFSAYVRNTDGTVVRVPWRTHGGTFVVPPDGDVPDHEILTRCFRLAGDKTELPAEWQYLREARSWLNAEQTRHAVIDACTAAEIALAYQITQLANGTSKAVIEQLLKRCNGIASLADVVRKIGGTTASASDVTERLARLRNSAAHTGNPPTPEAAEAAVAVAAAILGHARPLHTFT